MTSALAKPKRATSAAVLVIISLLLSLSFSGTSTNLMILALVAAAWLSALACVGPIGIAEAVNTNRWGVALALVMLGYLIVAYRMSMSPDNSFAASWVLGAGPCAFVCASAIAHYSNSIRVLTISIVILCVALAVHSGLRFVAFGDRAHEPLIDPNNYATLLYLIWIPLVHWHLSRDWRGQAGTPSELAIVLGSSFALLLAIIATRSRMSLVLIFGAFVIWAYCALRWRVSRRRLLVHVTVAGIAFAVASLVNVQTAAVFKGIEFGGGLATRGELIRSALAMFGEHPMGIGVFCFPMLYPMFRSTFEQETAGLFVHNDYVQLLVEGGVPMLLLVVVFVAAVLLRGFRLLRVAPADDRFEGLGFALALAAVSAHAFVNFVFYSLPLSILIGLFAARLFAVPMSEPNPPHPPIKVPRLTALAAIAVGWVFWLYLALDVAVVGVFQNQPSLGFASLVRADEHRMLKFARVAQQLNGSRGIPALAEAILLYRAARAEPDSRYLRDQTYERFHHALSVDPWNSLTYVRLAQFLEEFPPPEGRAPGETTEGLLLSAISLDRLFVPAIDELLHFYGTTSQEAKGYALLRNIVYPWMPSLRRNDPDSARRYFDLLEGFAARTGDSQFLGELKTRRAQINRIQPRSAGRQSL